MFGRIGDLYRDEKPSLMLAMTAVAAILGFALVVSMTGPVNVLLGESAWATVSALHGMSSLLLIIAATMSMYLGWRLLWGRLKAYSDLRTLATISAFLSILTVAFGNWIYIAYRAKGGPRTYFLENNPEIHKIFFEFKEFSALFTVPLFVGAAWALWTYGPKVVESKERRAAIALTLVLGWVFLILVFVLGAAITKLRSV